MHNCNIPIFRDDYLRIRSVLLSKINIKVDMVVQMQTIGAFVEALVKKQPSPLGLKGL